MKYMLITGASSGIGFETFFQCFKKNIYPIALVRNIQSFNKNLTNANLSNNQYASIRCDLEDIDSVENIVKEVKKITKKLDHLVLNAGFIETSAALMTPKFNIEKHLNINFISQILIAQSIAKSFFIKQKAGTIVAVSSSAAIDANEARMAYAASKSALSTAIRVLSKELGRVQIRANVVAPGLTDTKLMRNSTEPDQINKFINELSLKKLGRADEIAKLIHFLSSEDSSFITGQIISIDGGIR